MRSAKLCPVLLAAAAGLLAAGAARAQCTGPNHVTWPAVNPVWDFCWTRPSQTLQPNGEGIRITNLKYKGVTVLKDAGVPVLNVLYVPGGCGCFRDWFDSERAFECAPVPSAGYCTGTATPPTTVCNHPGSDAGSFSGVAVHDKGTSLKLISQTQAGWYRYIATWEFFPDGSFRPGMDITSVNNSCVASTHDHHAYWRMDFDVDGSGNDFAHVVGASTSQRQGIEASYIDTPTTRTHWRLGSTGSRARVHVERTEEDGDAQGDTFGKADGWLLAYSASELTDSGGGCAINIPYVTGQDVDDADIVLWVHSQSLHIGEPGGISHDCGMFGPIVKVRLQSTPADFEGDATSDLKLWRDGTWVSVVSPF
jgi:hypothetical protein